VGINKLDLVLLQMANEVPGNPLQPHLFYLWERFLNLILAEYHGPGGPGFLHPGNTHLLGNRNQMGTAPLSSRLLDCLGNPFTDLGQIFSDQ
jgi:hypothetical protein